MSTEISFEAIDSVIHSNDAVVDLAEAHGVLSGMLCVSAEISPEAWLAVVFETEEKVQNLYPEDREVLCALFEQTLRDISDHSAQFDLFLPDDEYPLIDRLESLGEWSRGFLFGLGAVKQLTSLSVEATEILVDLSEIAKVELSSEGGEEDEEAYMELQEYIRVAVQLLQVELEQQLEKTENTVLN